MEPQSCSNCEKPKAELTCQSCQASLCKACTQFLDEDPLHFIIADLSEGTYCGSCFDMHVVPKLEAFNELLARAKNVNIYEKKQAKETRLLKRTEKPLQVANCRDLEEVILRLALIAAQNGFNCVIDVQSSTKKTKDGSYTMLTWAGSGIPTQVQENRIVPDRALRENPN